MLTLCRPHKTPRTTDSDAFHHRTALQDCGLPRSWGASTNSGFSCQLALPVADFSPRVQKAMALRHRPSAARSPLRSSLTRSPWWKSRVCLTPSAPVRSSPCSTNSTSSPIVSLAACRCCHVTSSERWNTHMKQSSPLSWTFRTVLWSALCPKKPQGASPYRPPSISASVALFTGSSSRLFYTLFREGAIEKEMNPWFLSRHAPWENEQLGSVYEYLDAKFAEGEQRLHSLNEEMAARWSSSFFLVSIS